MKLLFVFFCVIILNQICHAKENNGCLPSSCGNIPKITFPFRLTHQQNCSNETIPLSCENNRAVLEIKSTNYIVQSINYDNQTIRLVDSALYQNNNCSSLPRSSFSPYNTTDTFSFTEPYHNFFVNPPKKSYWSLIFVECAHPVMSSRYVDTRPCINGSTDRYSYVIIGSIEARKLEKSCSIKLIIMTSLKLKVDDSNFISFQHLRNHLIYGFELSWRRHCQLGFLCFLVDPHGILRFYVVPVLMLAERILCGIPCVACFLLYKWRRRHLSMDDMVEDFLQSQNGLMPIRYSFSNIKKITEHFKYKLGEGAYGCVYKGKLRSGRSVAVKLLGKSKANGQEFINEVSTIGRIHHVNVVELIGFCSQGSKRALVYDFMPNGSLEKHTFPAEGNVSTLSCMQMYEISLGIARGIEYLHRGCNIQILHFDIKPHNILLDENFIPKVSDFGLAKLYATEDSIVSLTAARGTMGYIAPELFYKNIGGISYKADVYSFGMLLTEMAGRRKNLNPQVDHLSQIYFPSWAYGQYSEGNDIAIGEITEEENKIMKKMILVALWCIQLKPSDRPSMTQVVEMLEGEVESIEMPPKPFLCPQDGKRRSYKHQEEPTKHSKS